MKKMKKTTYILFLITAAVSFGCSGTENIYSNDYFTNGFLNSSCYQLIIKARPDTKTKGLVESRESAYIKAKSRVKEEAIKSLVKYIASQCRKPKKHDSVLRKKLSPLLKHGIIVNEYYDENNSVNLVYRICRKGLRKEISGLCTPATK